MFCSQRCRTAACRARAEPRSDPDARPGLIPVPDAYLIQDFAVEFGQLEQWSENDPRAVGEALDRGLRRVMCNCYKE